MSEERPSAMGPRQWEARRGTLCHSPLDSLCRAVGYGVYQLETTSDIKGESIWSQKTVGWPGIAGAFAELLDAAEPNLSPRWQLTDGSLKGAPPSTRAWLGELTETLWHQRSEARTKVGEAQKALEKARAVFESVPGGGGSEGRSGQPRVPRAEDWKARLSEFAASLRSLHRSMEALKTLQTICTKEK